MVLPSTAAAATTATAAISSAYKYARPAVAGSSLLRGSRYTLLSRSSREPSGLSGFLPVYQLARMHLDAPSKKLLLTSLLDLKHHIKVNGDSAGGAASGAVRWDALVLLGTVIVSETDQWRVLQSFSSPAYLRPSSTSSPSGQNDNETSAVFNSAAYVRYLQHSRSGGDQPAGMQVALNPWFHHVVS